MHARRLVTLLILTALAGCAGGWGSRSADEVPDPHPGFLAQWAETYRFRLGQPRSLTPTPDGAEVLFLRSGPRSFVQDLWTWDVESREERIVLTAAQVLAGAAEKLSAEELARRERMRETARGIASFRLSPDGGRMLVPLSGRLYMVARATGEVSEVPGASGGIIDARWSPDGARVAFVRDGDLHVAELETGSSRQLTRRVSATVSYGTSEFVAQEEMRRLRGYWWSPDGQKIAVQRTDVAPVETLYVSEPARPEREPQGWPFPRAGTDNADVRLMIFDVKARGVPVEVRWDHAAHPYLNTVRWGERGPLTVVVQDRPQREIRVLEVNPTNGVTQPMHVESDPVWLNLDQAVPRWLGEGAGFLWTTERDGGWALEQRARDGALTRTLVSADAGLRGVSHVDAASGQVFVRLSEDSTQQHVARVDLSDGSVQRVTEAPGWHRSAHGDGTGLWVHSYQTLDGARGVAVRGADGEVLGEISSRAEPVPFEPRLTFTSVALPDGRGQADVLIIRPQDFEPGRTYPVIEHVYAGPHGKMVTAMPSRYVLDQWFADHGFIVVLMDTRGTPNQGRAWERSVYQGLGTVPLEDHPYVLRQLGLRYPELDLGRVGIYGWSFGGYFSALAAMEAPELYRAAVAGAPVCDWRDYDTHYTERYMGTPETDPEAYDRESLLTYAAELTRPLLVIHGTSDDNVYFVHALKLSDALFRAGRDHAFLPLAGFTHMVPEAQVTERLYGRILGFLAAHLTP